MILEVAGAATQMPVKRLGDPLFKARARHRRPGQLLEQHLPFIEKTGGTVTALEREMPDEGLLQRRQLAVLGVALDRADGLAVEACR